MVGPKLKIGPTHALRLVLERGPQDARTFFSLMQGEHGVGMERAHRALRRALSHGLVREHTPGVYALRREVGTW